MMLNIQQLQLCDIQGRLFENSISERLDSRKFVDAFMNSFVASQLDEIWSHEQWAGEEYLMEELRDEIAIPSAEDFLYNEALYWAGYLYRYWHYYKNISSKEIYAIADIDYLNLVYPAYHTLDVEMAIDRIYEAREQAGKL